MTEQEIEERVARALFESDTGNHPYPWDAQVDWAREPYLHAARAAIRAFGDATEGK